MVAWMGGGDAAWERFTGPVGRLARLIPERGARGLPPLLRHVPGVADVRGARHGPDGAHGEPRRRALGPHGRLGAPRRARATCAARTSASSSRCATSTSRDTRVYLGIVLPLDGVRRRCGAGYATASRYLDDFGVAMYCGFGRQPGRTAGDDASAPRHARSRSRAEVGARLTEGWIAANPSREPLRDPAAGSARPPTASIMPRPGRPRRARAARSRTRRSPPARRSRRRTAAAPPSARRR